MKRNLLKLISLSLCLVLLCGCTAGDSIFSRLGDFLYSDFTRINVPDFSDMKYSRPDLKSFGEDVDELKSALEYGDDYDYICSLIDQCYAHYYNFDTMYTLSNIRYCHDNSDAYYAEEYFWCEENFPLAQQLMDEMYYACGGSDIAVKLENDVFWEGFAKEYSDRESSIYTETLISLMQRESELLSRYRELRAAPLIELHGIQYDLNELLSDPFLTGDENTEAVGAYYRQYNSEFADIYINLVKTRQAIAHELGYESYEQMQYEYTYERNYSPEEARAYTQDIKRYMVPLYRELTEQHAADYLLYEEVSEDMLMSAVGNAAANMDKEIYEAFSFMAEHELCDVSSSPLKSPMSFQIYITDYDVPYVFMDATGDSYDILTFSHEFGHYLDGFVNFNSYETLDLSEAYSQAMEYLMLFYYEDYPDEEGTDMLRSVKMLDTLDMYVNQACFAEFESIIYSASPEKLSAEFINELFLELSEQYGTCGDDEKLCAMSWCDIVHFFEMPFYVISYPVSNDAAMQIYELELEKEGAGLEKYLEMLPREHSNLIDTLDSVGLESPFAPGRIQKVVTDLSALIGLSFADAA